jgi:hypothetical protein
VTAPSAEDFRALARSSPWRWSTLRFTARWSGPWVLFDPVRAWLRRPDRLRVETSGGALVQVVRSGSGPQQALLTASGGVPGHLPSGPGDQPRFRPDGLVADRPPIWESSADDPMFQSYSWVAMLDPLELADGHPEREGPGVVVGEVSETEHGGRPAWQAVLSTTPGYEPRCACCPLLPSADAAALDAIEAGGSRPRPDGYGYGTVFLVRLDVGTGVCVLTEQLDGTDLGRGHDLRIEAVDEPMADDLFAEPRRRSFGRR